MRILLTLVLFLILASPAAATPNEDGLRAQLSARGVWLNTGIPIYYSCVSWLSQAPDSWQQCGDSSYQRVNFDLVNNDFSPKIVATNFATRWAGVPLPAGWTPGGGSDHSMVVVNHTGQHYQYVETWLTRRNPDNGHWTGVWGAGVQFSEMTADHGLYVMPTSPDHVGVAASGIALWKTMITLQDMRRGLIDHPMRLVVPDACGFKWPATRDDGVQAHCAASDRIQYGAKYKLPASVDVDAIRTGTRWCAPSSGRTAEQAAALGWDPTTTNCPLPPLEKAILKGLQSPSDNVYVVAADQGGSPPAFEIESSARPLTSNWTGASTAEYRSYFGCDGYNNTGQWTATYSGYTWNTSNGVPVGGDAGPDGISGTTDDRWIAGDWESDCAMIGGIANATKQSLLQLYEVS